MAALGVCAVPTFAQFPHADVASMEVATPPTAGIDELGDVVLGPVDIETQIGENGVLGVAYDGDEYHISSRVLNAGTGNQVFFADATGTVTGQYDQIAGALNDAWGYRDGMTDGEFVYFGWGGGLARHNLDGSGGTLHISGGSPGGVWRALGYDPDGNGGAGSFYTADFGSAIYECEMDGTVIRSFTNSDGWSLYGLTVDPCTGNLWGHHSGGADTSEAWEIDTETGRFTGVSFSTQSGVSGAIQGGLSGVPGGAGTGNFWDFGGILQATPDSLVGWEGYVDPCGGGLALTLAGDCPGTVTASVSGATPGGNVAFIRAFGEGSVQVPPGPCEGTELGLDASATLLAIEQADANGNASIAGNAPNAACGRVFVQALDLGSCSTSNVELVQ